MIGGVAVKNLLLITLLILLLVGTSLGLTAVAENGKRVILGFVSLFVSCRSLS